MYITVNEKNYECQSYRPSAGSVSFHGVTDLKQPVTGIIKLCADFQKFDKDGKEYLEPFEMASIDSDDFERVDYSNDILTLTNLPEPPTPPEPPEPPIPDSGGYTQEERDAFVNGLMEGAGIEPDR